MERENKKPSRWETQLLEEFVTLFKRSGKTEEEAREIMAGISGADLKNSPEIKRLIEEAAIDSEKWEKRSALRDELQAVEAQLKAAEIEHRDLRQKLEQQIEVSEAEYKKRLDRRDEILRKLSELSGGKT